MAEWKKIHQEEAVKFVRDFYQTSYNWRNESYHSKWDSWERNYRNIYDTRISALKDSWQARMFIPMTITNVEVIVGALQKLLMGSDKPMGLLPRESGDQLQAELHTALLRQLNFSRK